MPMKSTYPTQLVVCDVLKERFGKTVYIVLKTGKGSRWTHLIDIEHEKKSSSNHKALPIKRKTDELMDRLSEQYKDKDALERLNKLPTDVSERRRIHPFALSNRSDNYKEILIDPTKSKGWKLIAGLLTFDLPLNEKGEAPEPSYYGDEFEALILPETRRKRVLRYCKISNTSEDTVYRTFRRYCQRGLTPAAAADDYDLCGGRNQQREWKCRPGKAPRRRKFGASACDQEVRRLIALAADYYFSFQYMKGKRSQKTLEQALNWIRATFLRDRAVYNEKGEMVELRLSDRIVITVKQLQYYILKNFTYEERRIHKVGLRQYLLHERPLKGQLRTTKGPGERFHIDATVLDIYLVGQILRTKVIGRPVLYLVIDDYSGMAVGFYLTFDPPCWDGAMMALVNAISPKVEFCRSLDILIREDQWPACRLCEGVYADQGEVSSVHKAHPLISHYRVGVSNAPAYRPDLRSVMERRFGIIPAIWTSLVPGIVEKSSFDRGVAHPAYHAALDLKELRRVICYSLLSYNTRVIRGYPTPPEMIEREFAPTPLNLWKYGTEVNGCGRHVDVDEFRAKVMPKTTASIYARGILHNDLHYACPTFDLVERQTMFRAEGTETKVEITFDSTDNSGIQIHGLGEPITCPISEHDLGNLQGVTYQEQSLAKDLDATNRGMTKEAAEPERAKTDYNISKIAKEATSKTAKALRDAGMGRPDIKDIDEMRNVERSASKGLLAEDASKDARKTRRNSKTGGSFKNIIKKIVQGARVGASVEQKETYDEEGDAYERSENDANVPSDETVQMTSKELREKRARELLEEMDR
ncbi:DDE-type integrase/transposase/recombinase [Paraburkholderia sp. BL17N1]|uniref:DDE-type integrase/transposase/recombinase n=1 Tax=Paraburkholderia sp. BL17N1 TaxID=1938798 RepID=UPI000EB0B3C5|nr:DDE-type integrase/transposase/recombinase [Paraburkholderia sp. BL17N1]RKR36187.1 integrase-like protein [Paraburkholderia sp. BL17N1]